MTFFPFNVDILYFVSLLVLPRHPIKLMCNIFVNALRILNKINNNTTTNSWNFEQNFFVYTVTSFRNEFLAHK